MQDCLNLFQGLRAIPVQDVSVEMAVKHGPVALLSVIERRAGKLALLCAEAESAPGPILEIGSNNSFCRFT